MSIPWLGGTPAGHDDPAKLQAPLDHARDKLAVVDEDCTYRYANDAVERLPGYSPSEIVGVNAFDQVHPEDRETVRELFETLVACEEETTGSVAYRHRTAADGWVWLESRTSSRAAADLDGYVVSSRDVTDRKRAEQRERQTGTQLQQIAANTEDVLRPFSGDGRSCSSSSTPARTSGDSPRTRSARTPRTSSRGSTRTTVRR